MRRSVRPLAVALFVLCAATPAFAAHPPLSATAITVEEGNTRLPLLPLDVPTQPAPVSGSALDTIGYHLSAAWAAARGAVAPLMSQAGAYAVSLWTGAGEQAATALDTVGQTATPALAVAGEKAGELLVNASALATEARDTAEELAGALHQTTAELRNHPVVETAADIGILLRVAEVLGIGILVGGLAWNKLRGA